MKCEVCGAESGEYSLCKSCFDLMQEGQIVKCKSCEAWYNKDTICSCLKTQENSTAPIPKDFTAETEQDETNGEEKIGCLKSIITFILIFVFASVLSLGSVWIPRWQSQYQISNSITGMFKKEPTVNFVNSNDWVDMLEVQFNIVCPENYKKVVIEITIQDENKVVLVQEYLTGTDYKKDNVYRLSYRMSLEEALKAEYVKYKIHRYE